MRRRGFLGLLGGAAVAGPSMAKHAAVQAVSGLDIGVLSGGTVAGIGSQLASSPVATGGASWAHNALAKLGLRTAAQHEFYKKRVHISHLDPDIAAYRSLSLGAKIRMQREREYERSLSTETDYFRAMIAGWLD